MLYLGAAVAVAVAVLLVVVALGPSLTGSGSGNTAAVLTYSGAHPVADRSVGNFGGGGWTLLFAAGLVSPTTVMVPVNTTTLGSLTSYCTYTPVSGFSDLTLPGYSGNRTPGASPAWEFAYRNATGTIALVSVIDGQASVLATLSGLECAIGSQLFHPVPGAAIDSSQAAADVAPLAGAFLVEHPNASAVFGLVGGGHFGNFSLSTEWSITYTSCSVENPGSGTGDTFNATVNATTGAVIESNLTTDGSCASVAGGALTVPGTSVVGAVPDALRGSPRGSG